MATAIAGIYAVLLLSPTLALPPKRSRVNSAVTANNFIGEGTNELATAILQGYVDLESNLAFSPLGYSTLLAILAEGGRGDTRDQLVNALHLPEDRQVTRSAYKAVLGRLNERNSVTHPEFRNWFYVYKNFSVEPDYKAILQENYLTEVKDIDRLDVDTIKDEGESMETSGSAPVAVDVLVPEESIKEPKPGKSEVAESMALKKLIHSILPEKIKYVMPEKSYDVDKLSDKTGDSTSFSETEEIMQVSEEDPIRRNQEGPLKIVFPIPFPEKLKLRKMFDEREVSPSGTVLTMQEEMLGSKEIEKDDDKNRDEKVKVEKTEEMKGEESMGEKMGSPSDTKKEDTMEEIKDEIKNDNIKESDNVKLVKDQKEGNKIEAMQADTVEKIKNDKSEISQDDKMEATKDDKMEAMEDDKMEGIKDDTIKTMTDGKMEETKDDKIEVTRDEDMEAVKGDKMETVKEDKMEVMENDKMEVAKEDKMDATKDEKIEAMKDNQMEATKDDKMEAMKDDKMEATKDDKVEATKDDKMEATKDDSMEPAKGAEIEEKKDDRLNAMIGDKMEVTKDDKIEETKIDNMEAAKDDCMEATKDDKMQAMKDDKMEAMKVDKTEAMKDDKMEAMKVDKTEAMKDDKMEAMKVDKTEAMKDDKMEAMKVDKTEAMKDEKTETINVDMVTNDKENENTDATVEGIKDKVTTDDIKQEEIMMEDKEKKKENTMAGAAPLDPVNENMEVMTAVDRKARHLNLPRLSRVILPADDVTSSLSGNNIVRKGTKSEKISQMLVFNGLYFKGIWATPFLGQKEDTFYTSDSEKRTVTMMNTQGNFRVGNVPELDSMAIELPYKGDKYSLLVLIPNSRSGLRQLISDLAGYSLRNVQKHLQTQEVEVSLPSFEIETTTRPIDSLKKFGVSDVFSKDKADLSCISKDSGLFVDDLVQLVTVRVDNGSSSYNQITAGNPSARSGLLKFVADHPFLYFVRDTEDSIIVVAGKVTDPSNIRTSL